MPEADPSKVRFVALRRTVQSAVDPQAMFSALTEGGDRTGCVLLQSSDNIPKYGERSLAAVGSSLRLEGRGSAFSIQALDDRGRSLLPVVSALLSEFADVERVDEDTTRGMLEPDLSSVSGRDRPSRPNHMDIIRAVAFCGVGDTDRGVPTHGLFGCLGYTFIHQYERFNRNGTDPLDEPDYVLFLATRLFTVDHAAGVTHFVSSVPVIEGKEVATQLVEAEDDVRTMVGLADDTTPSPGGGWRIGAFSSDTDEQAYCSNVEAIRHDIYNGRIFQAVYGRTISAPFEGNPFDVYCRLSRLNPSPYMFYVRDRDGTLLAASPEMAVRVTREEDHTMRVEVRPIAGTKPRGLIDGRVDPLLDAKYETSLKIDPKELAEHTMLVDLARNDVSSVCKPGTTIVDEPFVVEKYSHVQHLVSNVSGVLRDDLDALHAYLATMNMGTVTGAPKLEAMKIINSVEATSRGLMAGGVGYITPDGEMDSALVIRAIRFKDGRVHVRAAAGIVADSVAKSEWTETANKAEACLRCLREGHEARSQPTE